MRSDTISLAPGSAGGGFCGPSTGLVVAALNAFSAAVRGSYVGRRAMPHLIAETQAQAHETKSVLAGCPLLEAGKIRRRHKFAFNSSQEKSCVDLARSAHLVSAACAVFRVPLRISYARRMATRTPIMAAGGIVIRNGAKPLLAVVQRRRANAWVLPKGKLKPSAARPAS
jgi:hypothetical protein